MVNRFRKSQAALEFLTTYAWAFLIILITLSALYYFGIFDFGKYLPQKCVFTSQFKCLDYSMKKDTDTIKFKLLNDIGEEIFITGMDISNEASPPLTCISPLNLGNWKDDEERDFEFTSCQDGGFLKKERIEAKINFTYYAVNTPTQPIHNVRGKIIGQIQ